MTARVPALVALVALTAASPLAAQRAGEPAGRWRLELQGAGAPVRGELRLTANGGVLAGSMLLETVDSGPLPIQGRVLSDTTFEFSAPLGAPTRFAGRISQDRLEGVVQGDVPRSWTADRLGPTTEYYAALPRFTSAQVIAGRSDSAIRVPGRWLAAARAAPGLATFPRAYADAVRQNRLTPLRPDELARDGRLRLFGLYRRGELMAAVRATLDSMRRVIPTDSTRARFDAIFRPRGEWIVDLHDAALLRAQVHTRGTSWDGAMRALRAVDRVPERAVAAEAVPVAMYQLLLLARSDPAALQSELARMQRAEPASASVVATLLGAYSQVGDWYLGAVSFLLTRPWLPDSLNDTTGGHSPADDVRRLWRREERAFVGRDDSLPVPRLELELFGYPQGVPRYGVPPRLLAALVRSDNWSATEWVRRHGRPALAAALHQLPLDSGPASTLTLAGETFRLTTVRRQSEESLTGFLEPADAVRLDPGYVPLFALATVVHEWQHLLLERLRLERATPAAAAAGASSARAAPRPIVLPTTDPYLSEGFAEWRTERALAPAAALFPLVLFGETEKRLRLVQADSTDPHVLGYLLVRAAADGLDDPSRFTAALVRRGDDPVAVAAEPALASRWARYRGAPDWTLRSPSRRVLVPETTFTIEDNLAELVNTRIIAPEGRR